jgi:signal transduction histidine kinase
MTAISRPYFPTEPARAGQMTSVSNRLTSLVLRVPLLGKLLGANLLVVVVAIVAQFVLPAMATTVQLAVVLVLSFGATALLVWLALRPVSLLEMTADRVAQGDFSARVVESPLADRSIGKLAVTMNRLLDRVQADRARIQYLAGRSVRARDIEREFVARELRDSFAQSLAAVSMQLSAAAHATMDPDVVQAIGLTHKLAQDLTEEMRSVAETLYPGTLGEFGLTNAIEALARRVSRRSGLRIDIDAKSLKRDTLSAQLASALYRVADEALRNVEQHANAQHAFVRIWSNGQIVLEIEDDGRGLDMRATDPLQAGLGLFSAKAVLALAGGELQISSAPELGTRITARAPIAASKNSQ